MMNTEYSDSSPRKIKIPGHRLRRIAEKVLKHHPLRINSTDLVQHSNLPITVVCISDTHNNQPELPPGDLLIHAGDLTENGSFHEVQAQLKWLSSQQHQHKVVIAGNHDVLLDTAFLKRYPERTYGNTETLEDLDWGDVQYLNDSSVTLDFSFSSPDGATLQRTLKIYGSPVTPQYGISAFQLPRDENYWENRVKRNPDVIVIHGPPHLHLDGHLHAGCPFLAHEIARVRPRLVVFGHIHVAYGREDLIFDSVQQYHDDIMRNWAGLLALVGMCWGVAIAKIQCLIWSRTYVIDQEKATTFVNAAVVGLGLKNVLKNAPVVLQI